jgi:hypothetical protein
VSSAPAPQFEPIEPVENAEVFVQAAADPPAEAPQEELDQTEPAEVQPYEYIGVIHLTRTWVQYGIFGFAVVCIVIGAIEALFGR